jgi:NADH dehydrogenase/putative oxidoreductase
MANAPSKSALKFRRANVTANAIGFSADAVRFSEVSLFPFLDLVIRVWLAQIFWRSGLLKLLDFDLALYLAANEYPVSWMDPVTAAYLGVAIEVICPIFLVLGLGTRLAAIPLLILSLVIYSEYSPMTHHLFWAALFGWYMVMGAGPLSLDRLLVRGFSDSALPYAASLQRGFAVLTHYVGPIYQLLIRVALAGVLVVTSRGVMPPIAIYLVAGLLVIGLGSRITAALMIFALSAIGMLAHGWQPDYPYLLMSLALIALRGPGFISLDHWVKRQLGRRFPQLTGQPAVKLDDLPQVVVVGAGFGGLSVVRGLRNTACKITLIDKHNYHLFQPLLYQVGTAALSPADIATPVRGLFRTQYNVRVVLGGLTDVDTDKRQVIMDERPVPYDYLILATGARHSYFGKDEWEPYAPGLKRIEDATEVRRRLLLAFEHAENSDDADEQRAYLTFVIVGAGPTGVELAGAIAELAHWGMEGEFYNIDPKRARVILVQSGPRVLPAFHEKLSEQTQKSLEALGVEVRTNSRVQHVDELGVTVGNQRISARTVFWAAGVIASPAASWLGSEADRAGRIKVDANLRVPGLDDIYAIGDTAHAEAWQGKPVPGLAPAAKQEGAYVANAISARIEGRRQPKAFRYRHLGNLATIGRKSAVVEFGSLRLAGALAWWFWGAIHILFLSGMRNRLSVALEWFWAYLTFRRGTRLITGDTESAD